MMKSVVRIAGGTLWLIVHIIVLTAALEDSRCALPTGIALLVWLTGMFLVLLTKRHDGRVIKRFEDLRSAERAFLWALRLPVHFVSCIAVLSVVEFIQCIPSIVCRVGGGALCVILIGGETIVWRPFRKVEAEPLI